MSVALRPLTAAPATLAPALFVVTFVAASLRTPGYSHVSMTVSALAAEGQPHAMLLSAGFIAYGAMIVPLGYAFASVMRSHGRRGPGLALVALFALYGLSDLLAGVFTDDLLGASTTEGLLHDAAARAGFAAVTMTMIVFAWGARSVPELRRLARFGAAMAALTLILGFAFQSGLWETGIGVWQLGFVGTTLAWVQVSSVRLVLRG